MFILLLFRDILIIPEVQYKEICWCVYKRLLRKPDVVVVSANGARPADENAECCSGEGIPKIFR